jgi:hypothetical protein
MPNRNTPIILAILVVSGCTVPKPNNDDNLYKIGNIPDTVRALTAPGQDLASARLLKEDDCYWYAHSGPVETTLVPLRAVGGSPICISRQTS